MAKSIQSLFMTERAADESILETARECSALTDPVILPYDDLRAGDRLPEAFQSVGAEGVTIMKGRIAAEMYPPGRPWYLLDLPAHLRHDPAANVAELQAAMRVLRATEIAAQAVMESAGVDAVDQRRPGGFASQKLVSIAQFIVTGDSLERIGSDYRVRVYRRDQYITRRDDAGDVLFHIIREKIDPFTLTQDEFNAAGLNAEELAKAEPRRRMVDLWTHVEWDARKRHWQVYQEVNEKEINRSIEKVTPYIATACRLAPGEHYGRGPVELHLGSLRTLNELERRRLEILGAISKITPVSDYASLVKPRDFARKTGEPIKARVRGGQVEDVAFLHIGNIQEHRSLVEGIMEHTRRLERAFLMGSASVRDSERTTAYEVSQNASEINTSLGGAYIPLVEQQHIPTLRRVLFQMRKDRRFKNMLPEKFTDIRSLTGLSATIRENKARALLEFAQVGPLLGEAAMRKVNAGAMLDAYARYRGINEPGLMYTDEEVAAQDQARADMETQQALAQARGQAGAQAAADIATSALGAR